MAGLEREIGQSAANPYVLRQSRDPADFENHELLFGRPQRSGVRPFKPSRRDPAYRLERLAAQVDSGVRLARRRGM
jgi:hypothetical protein